MRLNTCRLCRRTSYDRHRYPLIKYGPRHYAHADCGLRKWGKDFFVKLPRHELEAFPALAAADAGLLDHLFELYALKA